MAATLRDIASRLGISTAVVSRVLNDKPGTWASRETRQRILELARELNYRPSASARALVTGRSMQLAISAADPEWQKARSGRMTEVVGFVQSAARHRYRVLIIPSPDVHPAAGEFETLAHSGACEGFCIYAEQADAELYALLERMGVPFIVVGNPGDSSLPQVDQDNYAYGYRSVRWLLEQGRRRIALAYPVPLEAPFLRELYNGFRDALKDGGARYREDLVFGGELSEREKIIVLSGRKSPDAVIVCGAGSLLRWRSAASAVGKVVPQHVMLLSHVERSEIELLQPGDAYHAHNPALVGERAGELLIEWIENYHRPDAPSLVAPAGPAWAE